MYQESLFGKVSQEVSATDFTTAREKPFHFFITVRIMSVSSTLDYQSMRVPLTRL